ncbi:MAG: hypothetical protein WC723_04135 [Candidatus Omnitrophota bacterium]
MTTPQVKKDAQEGKFFAVISYISFLCVITLLLKKGNKFALYHAKQGLVLFVFEVAAFIISIVPLLGWLLGTFGLAVFSIFSLWGILQALMGKYPRFPIISDIADNITI